MKNSDSLSLSQTKPNEIEITRKFNAQPRELYRAYVHPEILKNWLRGPQGWRMIVCTFNPVVGGAYRYQWRHESGQLMGLSGSIQEISPDEKIVFTEKFDEAWYPGSAVVTTTFRSLDSETTLMTTAIRYESNEAMLKVLNSGMAQGISVSYDRLEEWFSNKH